LESSSIEFCLDFSAENVFTISSYILVYILNIS